MQTNKYGNNLNEATHRYVCQITRPTSREIHRWRFRTEMDTSQTAYFGAGCSPHLDDCIDHEFESPRSIRKTFAIITLVQILNIEIGLSKFITVNYLWF